MKKLKSISEHFRIGWISEDPKQHEFYRTVLNDLAEDIEIRSRVTQRKLAETLGYLQQCESKRIQEKEELRMDMLGVITKDMGKTCKLWTE